jgi:alpha-tubulin suppressor-like RCC1 family protein/uncharacterized protein YjdB
MPRFLSGFGSLLVLSVLSCSEPTAPVRVAELRINFAALELASGASAQLSVVALDAKQRELEGISVQWSSADTSVATVSASGRVTAAVLRGGLVGSTRISATAGEVRAEVAVTVAVVPVAHVVIDPRSARLTRGDSLRLSATLRDSTGAMLTGRDVTWSSSASTTVAVSADGLILAITPGTAVIRARAGSVGDSVTVTVPAPVASVEIAGVPASGGLAVGQTVTLTATPKSASGGVLSDRNVVWSVAPTGVLTVSDAGVVTATAAGRATLTAESETVRGTASLTAWIEVAPPAAGGVAKTDTLLGGAVTLTVQPGSTDATALTVVPADIAPGDDRLLAGTAFTFGPRGTQFTTPLTLALRFAPEDIPEAKRARLRIFLQDDETMKEVPGGSVDLEGRRVLAPISHFSTYAVLMPPDPASVAVTAGNDQEAAPGEAVPVAPRVRVLDAQQRPAAHLSVRFSVVEGGGSITGGDSTKTDIDGYATLPGSWVLGSALGSQRLRASVLGAFLQADITATAAEITITSVRIVPAITMLDVGDTVKFQFEARDANGVERSARSVWWRTSNEYIASLSQQGVLAARSPGTVKVWLNVGLGWDSLTIAVRSVEPTIAESGPLLSLGEQNTCAVTVEGEALCWGINWLGQVGNGTTGPQVNVPASAGTGFVRVATGRSHSCGLLVTGRISCWGDNTAGELGVGSFGGSRPVPTPVASDLVFKSVAVGFAVSCALTEDGVPYCWGRIEGESPESAPTRLATTETFASLAAAGTTICGITRDARAFCWGGGGEEIWNANGPGYRTQPRQVTSNLRFRQVAGGYQGVCGITLDDALYCWGPNTLGAVGDSTTTARNAPVRIGGTRRFRMVAMGNYTCALDTESVLECWGGRNDRGQHGDGTYNPSGTIAPIPRRVAMPERPTSIAVGNDHACATVADGTLYCWGYSVSGRLGIGSTPDGGRAVLPQIVFGGHRFKQP